MKLEFRLIKLKESSKLLARMKEHTEEVRDNLRCEMLNEFIIVGEKYVKDVRHYKVNQLNENGLSIFGGLDLAAIALCVPQTEFEWDGETFIILDVPKENLTVNLIDDINRLNY